jgi:hypothetical protein
VHAEDDDTRPGGLDARRASGLLGCGPVLAHALDIVTGVAPEEASAGLQDTDPLVIGGLGGSGTRLVAQIAQGLGFYLGVDRNAAGDNLWFTLLLKRSAWYRRLRDRGDERPVHRALGILAKALSGRGHLDLRDRAFILRAATDVGLHGHDHKGNGKGSWASGRARSLLRAPPPPAEAAGWGWKEPNSHIYLPPLADHFPGLRYIHTVRHGLDMAFSPKRGQLHNWGWLYGVDPPADPDRIPRAQLRLWVEATRRAEAVGREALGDRFLLLNYDRLCSRPEEGVRAIADLAGVSLRPERLRELAALPKVPDSAGRHATEDLSGLDPEDLAALGELGFEPPAPLSF